MTESERNKRFWELVRTKVPLLFEDFISDKGCEYIDGRFREINGISYPVFIDRDFIEWLSEQAYINDPE